MSTNSIEESSTCRESPVLVAAIVVFVGSFCVFAILSAPTVTWMDSGELVAAGFSLGGAHPPGHPVHSLLIKLVCLFPFGDVAFRGNLLSAIAMAMTAAGIAALVQTMVPRPGWTGYAAALMFVCSPLAQANATRTEVYAPAAALLVWAVFQVVRFGKGQTVASGPLAAALGCGLAAAIHPLIAFAVAIPVAIWLVFRLRLRLNRLAAPMIVLGGLGLLAYAYLPLRALALDRPLFMWGDAATGAGFMDILTAPAYQQNFSFAGFLPRFVDLFGLLADGMGITILIGGLVGLCFGVVSGLTGSGLLLACSFFVVGGAATQRATNPDMAGYVLLAQVFLAPGVAIFASALVRTVLSFLPANRRLFVVCGLATTVPLIGVGWSADQIRVRDAGARRGEDVHRLLDQTVASMPAGPAVYFANGDHLLFAGVYHRIVAGGRPDVAIANAELCRDLWFLQFVKRQLPGLSVPYLDDGGVRGKTAERLAFNTMRSGFPVWSDTPTVAKLPPIPVSPVGRSYRLFVKSRGGPGPLPLPPLVFQGTTGSRVAGYIALTRAVHEARLGHLAAAAHALGLDRRYPPLSALPATVANQGQPSLFALVPQPPVLLFAPWQADLLADDLAWQAGIAAPPLGEKPVPPRRVHRMWTQILSGAMTPEASEIRAFAFDQQLATGRMLGALGKHNLAERHLEAMRQQFGDRGSILMLLGSMLGNQGPAELGRAEALFRRVTQIEPSNAEAFIRLGVSLAKQRRGAEAKAALEHALRIDPSRREVHQLLRKLPP